MIWHNATDLRIEGRGWTDTETWSDRLPARAKGVVEPAVWDLSLNTAGLVIRFSTDSGTIRVRYHLRSSSLAMSHMPATGVSGVDLYTNENGHWRYAATSKAIDSQQVEQTLVETPPARREFLLYFPLYNGVTSLEIGIDDAAVMSDLPRTSPVKPVVFYGSSIVQGGCASRPGMAYPAILGRWLDCPVINLGFSGNGRMQKEIANLLAELDVSAFVIDSLPNMTEAQVHERCEPLLATIRAARPQTPIVMVENVHYSNVLAASPASARTFEAKNVIQREIFDRLHRNDSNLHYVPAAGLVGDDCEATVDGLHPTDLGFHRFAQALLPHLQKVLATSQRAPRSPS